MKVVAHNRRVYFAAYLVTCAALLIPLFLFRLIDLQQLALIAGSFMALATLLDPRLGLVAVVASLSIMEVLPNIPLAGSFSAFLGAFTLGSFLFHVFIRRKMNLPRKLEMGFWLALALILWVYVSNPTAAVFLGDRVWIWTLIQLWLIAWLARILVNDPGTTRLLMIFFILGNLLSAMIVFEQGRVGATVFQSARGYGLGLGPNGTARYLLIALLGAYYVYMTSERRTLLSMGLLLVCAIVLALGVFYTVSRSGLVLILVAAGLILMSPSADRKRMKWGFLLLGGAALFYFAPDNLFALAQTILPSVSGGTDTAGLRYALWQAGIKMFLDSPVRGVGIGQFPYQLPYYGAGIVPWYHLGLTAHNMYIQLLSETGAVGLGLFIIIALIALHNLYKRISSEDYMQAMLGWVWLAALVIFLAGGLTRGDFIDKLFWMSLGVGFSIQKPVKGSTA